MILIDHILWTILVFWEHISSEPVLLFLFVIGPLAELLMRLFDGVVPVTIAIIKFFATAFGVIVIFGSIAFIALYALSQLFLKNDFFSLNETNIYMTVQL